MRRIIRRIDKIAAELEKKGYIKDAYMLDIIANTLEKIAWVGQESPQYNVLEQVKKALKRNNTEMALGILKNNHRGVDMFLRYYGDYATKDNKYPAKIYANSYNNIISYVENNDIPKALREIDIAQQALVDLEPIITERQKVVKPAPVPTHEIKDMYFVKGKKPVLTKPGDFYAGPGQKRMR